MSFGGSFVGTIKTSVLLFIRDSHRLVTRNKNNKHVKYLKFFSLIYVYIFKNLIHFTQYIAKFAILKILKCQYSKIRIDTLNVSFLVELPAQRNANPNFPVELQT